MRHVSTGTTGRRRQQGDIACFAWRCATRPGHHEIDPVGTVPRFQRRGLAAAPDRVLRDARAHRDRGVHRLRRAAGSSIGCTTASSNETFGPQVTRGSWASRHEAERAQPDPIQMIGDLVTADPTPSSSATTGAGRY
jgi:hypothetical protein